MWDVFKKWYQKRFSNPAAVILLVVLIIGILIVVFFGYILAPLLAGLIFAFVLESIVSALTRHCYFPRWLAVSVVYLCFLALLIVGVFGFLPLLWGQFSQVVSDFPRMLFNFHGYVNKLPTEYPSLFTDSSVHDIISSTTIKADKVASLGKVVLSISVASLPSIVSWLVYLFLVPLVVLFMLKDKTRLITWAQGYMPEDRSMVDGVWLEMQGQLGNYIRGKAIEIIIVGVVSYIGFWIFGLRYAPLLAVAVGLSVIIPYIGMVIVTIPVAIVGLMQFGLSPEFFYMFIVYLVIQTLDGNVLVPILYSETVNLHPIAIIAAVLFFGGIWGFWGLFFAIPLATLVKAVVNAWTINVVQASPVDV